MISLGTDTTFSPPPIPEANPSPTRVAEQLLGGALQPQASGTFSLALDHLDQAVAAANQQGSMTELKALLAGVMATASAGGNRIQCDAKTLARLQELTGVPSSVYVNAAAAAREAVATTPLPPPSSVSTSLPAPVAALTAGVGRQLSNLASAVQSNPTGSSLSTADAVERYANKLLQEACSRHGLNAEQMKVSVELPRSSWTSGDLRNLMQLNQASKGAAEFLAQMAEDMGRPVGLTVQLKPRGRMERTYGAHGDHLQVPVRDAVDAIKLRHAWDAGEFIQPNHPFNPSDHINTNKLRTLWTLAGNPVGLLRTRLRGTMQDAGVDLSTSIDRLLRRANELGPAGVRQSLDVMLDSFLTPGVKTADGRDLKQALLERVAVADEKTVVDLLTRWKEVGTDPKHAEQVNDFAAWASSNRLRDNSVKVGLVNVDTYDAVTVMPDSLMGRHGAPCINDVEINTRRIGLVNVSSIDMVTVVPDLARMILGGSALEKSAREVGLL